MIDSPVYKSPLRITFLAVMPSPYVQNLFAAMHADPRIDLRVLYLEQVAPDTYWGEQVMPDYARVLPGRWLGVSGARIHINPTVRSEIDELDSDLVVVVGYIGASNQLVMRHLTRSNKPWCFWGEIPGLHRRRGLGRWIRRKLQTPLRNARGIAAVGSHAVAAYRSLLMQLQAPTSVFRNLPYHCEIDSFIDAARERQQSAEVRFLYCGQLIERKGVDLLCQAFVRLHAQGHDVSLTLAGEGPLRNELQSAISADAKDRVRFLGFTEVQDLPRVFADHDVFVLPSRHDGWGVVVNQAVAAGMPVIATTEVGAANDLVIPGGNGFRIEPDSEEAIFSTMTAYARDRSLIAAHGHRSEQIARGISLPQAVDQWCEFFCACLADAVSEEHADPVTLQSEQLP